jgi:hypothetical protein
VIKEQNVNHGELFHVIVCYARLACHKEVHLHKGKVGRMHADSIVVCSFHIVKVGHIVTCKCTPLVSAFLDTSVYPHLPSVCAAGDTAVHAASVTTNSRVCARGQANHAAEVPDTRQALHTHTTDSIGGLLCSLVCYSKPDSQKELRRQRT